MNNLRQTMSLGIGGFQGRKGIKASQPLRIASFPLLAAFFGYLLLLLTEGDKKKLIYTQINDQFVNRPYGEAVEIVVLRKRRAHSSYFAIRTCKFATQTLPQPFTLLPLEKAYEESGNLAAVRYVRTTPKAPLCKGSSRRSRVRDCF